MRKDLVGIEDVAPSVLACVGGAAPSGLDGREVLSGSNRTRPVSVLGSPLRVSMRTDEWRFTYATGVAPFTGERLGTRSDGALYEARTLARGRSWDVSGRYPDTARAFRERLDRYIEDYQRHWQRTEGNRP